MGEESGLTRVKDQLDLRGLEGPSADLFLATLRRTPTANAEGQVGIGGWHQKAIGGDASSPHPSDRHGPSAFAVGVLREV